MRASLLAFLGIFCFLGCASTSSYKTHNKVAKAEAIQIASQLIYEMPDREAVKYLHQHGLEMDRPGAGDSFGWNLGFELADGGILVLDIHPKPLSPDGAWVNGRVTAAKICNWNFDTVAEIKLKNAP